MAAWVFGAVLTFPVGVVGRQVKGLGPETGGALVMAISVFDPHVHGVRPGGKGLVARPCPGR